MTNPADRPESARLPVTSSLNRKVEVVSKPIYGTLAAHQAAETDWDYHDVLLFADAWYTRLNERFRLSVPRVPLRLDPRLHRNCGGHFLAGHNEFGLAYEIAIVVPPPTQLHLLNRGELVGTLLHEQLHLLQELTGVPGANNYHNAQYRHTAERFGLLVDHRGHQTYAADSLFLELLAEQGVDPPRFVAEKRTTGSMPSAGFGKRRPPGHSTLRKWSCGCTNVRVGVAEFHARCTRPDCGSLYRPC